MRGSIDSCHALVLNADFRPLSYFPLSLWSWQDAIKAVFLNRVNIVAEYDRVVHSPYCGDAFPTHDLTFDHIVPRSRGGRTVWFNVVTACGTCNLQKGNRLPRESGMFPKHMPTQPTTAQLQENGRAFPPNFLHESWGDYLYWDTELDDD